MNGLIVGECEDDHDNEKTLRADFAKTARGFSSVK